MFEVAPKLRNLVRLAEIAGLPLDDYDRRFLAKMLRFNIESRYPDSYDELPSEALIAQIRLDCERVYSWLLQLL